MRVTRTKKGNLHYQRDSWWEWFAFSVTLEKAFLAGKREGAMFCYNDGIRDGKRTGWRAAIKALNDGFNLYKYSGDDWEKFLAKRLHELVG